MNTTKGADFSYYDNILNWNLYNWDFAFIKASEGLFIDSIFKEQWKAAKNKVYRSSYHYFHPPANQKEAVANFLSYHDRDYGELPSVIDLERIDSNNQTATKALEWIHEYRRLTNKKPIVYTSVGFINEAKLFNYPEFGDYPLWLAQYPYENYPVGERSNIITEVINDLRLLIYPHCPTPFRRLSFWQWTSRGLPSLVPGYPQNYKLGVDFDLYNGTKQQMKLEFNLRELEGDIPMPELPTLYLIDLIPNNSCNIRSAPSQGSTLVRAVTPQSTVLTFSIIGERTTAEGFDWYPIKNPNGYIAKTSHFTNLRPYLSVPPPTPVDNKPKSVTIVMDNGDAYRADNFIKL